MFEPFFSVIIPVYQVEQYLAECIESLQKQTFEDFEAILIDDGSTDSSGDICDSAAADDPRFRVIHQPNSGLSTVRNTGIKAATGKYLLFLDSDDMLQVDALMNISADLKNHNVDVWCGGCDFYPQEQYPGSRSALQRAETVVLNGPEALLQMLEEGTFYASACLNVCKRKTILGKNLFFKEKILHEDEEWAPRMLLAIGRICISPVRFYLYRQRSGSIISTPSLKRLQDCCCYGLDIAGYLQTGQIPEQLKKVFCQRATNFWIVPLTAREGYSLQDRITVFKNCCRSYPLKNIAFLIKANSRWKFLFFTAPLLRTAPGCKILYRYIRSRIKGAQ